MCSLKIDLFFIYIHYLLVMDIEIKNVEVYNQIANEFSEKRFASWNWIDVFLNSFEKNKTILDMGCGNGRNMTKKDLNLAKEWLSVASQKGDKTARRLLDSYRSLF